MVSFLALLPRSVTTFLYADSGSPEILWQAQHPPIQSIPLTLLSSNTASWRLC